jgi:WhiB family redox-sensing transcriptional regulator
MPTPRYETVSEETWDWQKAASCRDEDPMLFYQPDGESKSETTLRERRAKWVCHTCAVVVACRSHALRAREAHGVWGGLTAKERRDLWSTP